MEEDAFRGSRQDEGKVARAQQLGFASEQRGYGIALAPREFEIRYGQILAHVSLRPSAGQRNDSFVTEVAKHYLCRSPACSPRRGCYRFAGKQPGICRQRPEALIDDVVRTTEHAHFAIVARLGIETVLHYPRRDARV